MKTQGTDKWRYRREPKRSESRPFHPEDVGWHALACGIVTQAVEDYKHADMKLKQAQLIEDKSARARASFIWEREKYEIVKFFKSQWYGILCDIDYHLILRKLGAE